MLPLVAQSIAVQLGKRTTDVPKLSPCLLRKPGSLAMFRRDIKGPTFAVLTVRDVKVGAVQLSGFTTANTIHVATAAGGLGEAALDHDLRDLYQSLDEPPLLTHSLILRYAD